MEENSLGKRLKAARGKMTQADVCDKLGIPSVQTLSAYERDINSPTVDTLKKISKLYKVSTDWLLFGEEYDPQSNKQPIDYLSQLVEALDYFDFLVKTIYDGAKLETVVYLETSKYTSVDDFLVKWRKLRELLDDHSIEHDDYEMWISKRMQSVDFSTEKMPF